MPAIAMFSPVTFRNCTPDQVASFFPIIRSSWIELKISSMPQGYVSSKLIKTGSDQPPQGDSEGDSAYDQYSQYYILL